MTGLQRASVHVILTGASLAAFFGIGLAVNTITGYSVSELYVWAWLWAASSSLTLAITLATFCIEISDVLAAAWTCSPRGRHARR